MRLELNSVVPCYLFVHAKVETLSAGLRKVMDSIQQVTSKVTELNNMLPEDQRLEPFQFSATLYVLVLAVLRVRRRAQVVGWLIFVWLGGKETGVLRQFWGRLLALA